MINQKLMWMPLLIILVAATSVGTTHASGWDGSWGTSIGCGAYCAGQQDANYDHQNQLQYQPYGQCLPCHSQGYWNNFREGYDQQWSSYQGQSADQGSSINVYGNNNYVSTAQYSNQGQQQNPLQQLTHTICSFVNCDGPQPQEGGYEP
jgi:hypothetical protein